MYVIAGERLSSLFDAYNIISLVLYTNAAIVPNKTPYIPNFTTQISDTVMLIMDSIMDLFCVNLKCPAYSITL